MVDVLGGGGVFPYHFFDVSHLLWVVVSSDITLPVVFP